jgi:hypothetical protein
MNPHERIKLIGGTDAGGWQISVSAAIAEIRKGNGFYVVVGGKQVDVIIAEHLGHPYIKTQADGFQPNNLLALPACPK